MGEKIIILSLIAIGIYAYFRLGKKEDLKGVSLNNPLKIKEKGFTKDPNIKPPYPKLHKPESTTIHFPKKGGNQ